MANTNTAAALYGLTAQTINATAETALTQVVNGTATPILLSVPANWNLDGKQFKVHLIGKATGGTSATLILKIYAGTVAAGTNIAAFTVSGSAIPATGGNFAVDTTLSWDSTSGLLNGTHGGQINNTLTTNAANTQATGITSVSGLTFSASATFGAALSTNTVTVSEFSLEQV
jgi:hypothetical protein